MKRLFPILSLFLCLVLVPSVKAQFTTVSATVVDPNSVPYANCHVSASYVPSPTATTQALIAGSTFQTVVPAFQCDSFGHFSVTLVDNTQVSDGHSGGQTSKWSFSITSGPGYVAGPYSFTYTAVISGTTMDISAALKAAAAPFPALSSAFSGITSGTNTIAAMLVGTGASLGATGSGTITATSATSATTMPWSGLTAFPSGCTNQVITAILLAPTCTSLTTAFLPTTGTWAFGGTLSGNMTVSGNDAFTGVNSFTNSGAGICASFGVICVDGHTYACNDVGINAAIAVISGGGGGTVDARACNGTITAAATITFSVPINLLLDSSTLVLNGSPGISCPSAGFGSTIQGSGETNVTIKSTSSTADMFSVACSNFAIEDLDVNMANTVGRTSANSVFNISNAQGFIQHVRVLGPSGVNGGDIVKMGSSAVTTWTFRDITVVGGATWTDGWFAQAASGTVSGLYFDNIQIFNSTYSGQVFNFDTGVDTVELAHIQSGASGVIIHAQNTLAGQAPRWIHSIDSRLECALATNAVVQLDAVRDFKYLDGYGASCQSFVNIGAAASKVDISHNIIVNIQQQAIIVNSGSNGVKIAYNDLEDCGQTGPTGTYDCIDVKPNATDWDISHNFFGSTTAIKPKWGIEVEAGTSSFFRLNDNDGTTVAFGSGACSNGATGSDQTVWGNSGGCQNKLLDTATDPPIIGTGFIVPEGTAPGAVGAATQCYADSTAHAFECSYNNTGFGVVPLINRAQAWSAAQSFGSGDILPTAAGATDLGSTALPFGNLWLGTAATNNFRFQPAVTSAARVISMSDPGAAVNMPYTNNSDTTTTHVLHATATGNVFTSSAIATGDLPTAIPIGNIGTSGLSGTSPVTINAAGAIGCATCVTSAAALTSNAVVIGGGGQASSTISADTTTTHALFATGTAPAFRALATADMPATVVQTGQVNTGAAAMTLNMAASTTANSFVAPAQAGLTSGTNGAIAYDTTNNNTHIRTNAADSIAVAEAAALAANVIPKQTDATHGLVAASLTSDNGTALTYTGTGGVLSSGNNAILTTDFTDTSSASLQNVTGLNFTLPANTARNYEIDCNLMWSQATFSGITDQFGLQDVTVAPTRIDGYGLMSVAGPGAVITNAIYGVLTNLTTTTATAIVSAIPTVATINFAQLHFTVQQPSNASTSVLQIMVSQSTAADVIVVRAGSSCRLN